MNRDQLQSKLSSFYRSRIVTAPRGSWKWQNAYRVVSYVPHLCEDGYVRWVASTRGRKFSWPQMRERGYTAVYDIGSIHRHPVTRREAIDHYGLRLVQSVEKRGWKFV